MKISAHSTERRLPAHHAHRRGNGSWIKRASGLRHVHVAVLAALLATGCVPQRAGEMPPAQALGVGLGYLVASPLLILAGLLEGIVTAPYLLNADLHEMNRNMVDANTRVSFDETYQYAYDRQLADVPESGDTGMIFRHMIEATAHFQKVIKGYGVEDYDNYLLTAVRTADRDGYTLYAVVYRPVGEVRIVDENNRARFVGARDREYYRPILQDADGRPLDVVIDWAGVPRTTIKTQKGQAILMTLAANSVLINRRSDEYWSAERRWVMGDFEGVVAERKVDLERRMDLPG